MCRFGSSRSALSVSDYGAEVQRLYKTGQYVRVLNTILYKGYWQIKKEIPTPGGWIYLLHQYEDGMQTKVACFHQSQLSLANV